MKDLFFLVRSDCSSQPCELNFKFRTKSNRGRRQHILRKNHRMETSPVKKKSREPYKVIKCKDVIINPNKGNSVDERGKEMS